MRTSYKSAGDGFVPGSTKQTGSQASNVRNVGADALDRQVPLPANLEVVPRSTVDRSPFLQEAAAEASRVSALIGSMGALSILLEEHCDNDSFALVTAIQACFERAEAGNKRVLAGLEAAIAGARHA